MNGRHRVTRRRSSRPLAVTASLALVGSVCAVVVSTSPSPAAAADACLEPAIREVAISQGLPSYGSLVRGKTTLVKAYLSEKQTSKTACSNLAGASVYITGGSLSVSTSTQPVPLAVPGGAPLPAIVDYAAAVLADVPADPVFTVPGSLLSSAVSSAGPITFTGTLSYVAKDDRRGTVLQSGTVALSTTPIAKTLAKQTRPLRLLVVPMGDSRSATPALSATALSTLQNAVVAAGRIQPVADGVGDIADPTGGVRYRVAAGTLEIGPHEEMVNGELRTVDYLSNGRFCGGGGSFSYIRQKLGDFRAAWNAANPSAPADRVLGVVSQELSEGPTTTSGSTCAEGYAAVNGPEAWARLAEPATGSPSGATAALELNHTYGGVVGAIGYHSNNAAADGTAPGRAFNLATLRQVPNPKSVMRFDVTAWDNYNTLYEKRDWDFTLCMLGSTASPSSECGSATSGGTTAPAGGGFVLTGRTDLTAVGTDVRSRFDPDPPTDGTDATSDVRLAFRDGGPGSGALISHVGLRATNIDSEHSHTETGDSTDEHGTYGIDVAIPGSRTAAFEIWRGTPDAAGSTRLYRRELNGAPSVGPVTSRLGATRAGRFTTDAVSSRPSTGGGLVAVSRGGSVVLSSTSGPAPLASVPGIAGTLDSTGATLTVVDGGDVVRYAVSRTGGAVSLGAATTVYDAAGPLSPGAAQSALTAGSLVVLAVAGDLYTVDLASPLLPATSTLCGVGDVLPIVLPGNPCSRFTTSPAVDSLGSWSPQRGLLAWTATTGGVPAVLTGTPSTAGSAVQRIAERGQPSWAGDLLLVSGPTGLLAYDAATYGAPTQVTTTSGDAQVSADGPVVFFTRPGAAPASDVWQLRLDRRTLVISATDETPRFIRHDVYADCGNGLDVLAPALHPQTFTATTAVTEVTVDLSRTCASPVIQVDTTDGYSVTTTRTAPTAGSRTAGAAIYSPRNGETLLSFDDIVVAGEATGDFVYTLFGPPGSAYAGGVVVGTSPNFVVAPTTGGNPAGTYRLRLSTSGDAGTAVSEVTLLVTDDRDGDGLPDAKDTRAFAPCYPDDALTSSKNAVTDYDGDLVISLLDPDPCTSALNAVVDFDANSINLAAAGNTVTVYVTTSAVTLSKLTPASTRVVKLGGFDVSLPALSVTPTSATRATLKFDRQAFAAAYQARGITGYVPVLIRGTDTDSKSFAGFDPDSPTYTP